MSTQYSFFSNSLPLCVFLSKHKILKAPKTSISRSYPALCLLNDDLSPLCLPQCAPVRVRSLQSLLLPEQQRKVQGWRWEERVYLQGVSLVLHDFPYPSGASLSLPFITFYCVICTNLIPITLSISFVRFYIANLNLLFFILYCLA